MSYSLVIYHFSLKNINFKIDRKAATELFLW